MKSGGVKSDNFTIVAVFAVFLAVAALSIFNSEDRGLPMPSTYSNHELGLKAFFILLEETGYDARRLRREYDKLPADADVLFVASDRRFQVASDEFISLDRWLEEGKTLVLGYCAGESLAEKLGYTTNCGGGAEESVRANSAASLLNEVKKAGPFPKRGVSENPDNSVALMSLKDLPLILAERRNKGKIYVMPFETLFSNENISKNDNARLAHNLAGILGRDSVIYFDEFHQGFTERGEKPVVSLSGLAFGTPYGLFTLQIFFAALLFFVNRDGLKRVGVRKRALSASPLEFANAAAELCRRAGAYSTSAGRMIEIFERDISRATGGSAGDSLDSIAGRFPPDSEENREIQRLSELNQRIKRGERISPDEAMSAARSIEKLKTQIAGFKHARH